MKNKQGNKGFSKDNKNPKDNKNRPINDGSKEKGISNKQDPFFYAYNEQSIKDLASFPFLEVATENIDGTNDAVPCLISIEYAPTVGADDLPTGVKSANYKTRAADSFFQYVTQGFTGGVNFEAPDAMMVELAACDLLALLAEGARAYGLVKYFLQFNSSYAENIVNSLGFMYQDIRSNYMEFRAEFNIRVQQINKLLAVPKGFMIGSRWRYICSYLFTDTESPEYSTAMAYKHSTALIYDPTYLTTGTCLRYVDFQNAKQGMPYFTRSTYFSLLDMLIARLVDDDVRDIFGAIRRVYSDNDLVHVEDLSEDFLTPIVKNDVVSATIHNARFTKTNQPFVYSTTPFIGYCDDALYTGTPDALADKDIAVYQDASGSILSHPSVGNLLDSNYAAQMFYNGSDNVLLDMYDHLVNPGNVLDITANMQVITGVTLDSQGSPLLTAYLLGCRCEAIVNVLVHDKSNMVIGNPMQKVVPIGNVDIMLARYSKLDSFPILEYFDPTDGNLNAAKDVKFFIGELDKYTLINKQKLFDLHNRTMYQLLSMPANTKSVTK